MRLGHQVRDSDISHPLLNKKIRKNLLNPKLNKVMYVCMGDIWADRWTILSQPKFPEFTDNQILLSMVLCHMCF